MIGPQLTLRSRKGLLEQVPADAGSDYLELPRRWPSLGVSLSFILASGFC